jgi:hypothetical protein
VGNLILEIKGMFFHYWAIFFTVSCLANMIGLNLSAGLNSVSTAYIAIPFILVPQLLFSGVLIPFDRLNNIFDNPEYVPVIGELMPSKWAYEAVAVHQFKGNKFTREFFDIDQTRANQAYQAALVHEVKQRLNEIWYGSQGGVVSESSKADLELVRNELTGLSKMGVVASFGSPEGFTPSGFTEEVYARASDSLDRARKIFMGRKRDADRLRDLRALRLAEEWGGEEAFNLKKKSYTNERLENLLLNKKELLTEWNNHLVRKIAPIYQIPRSRMARAQLFAPVKRVGPYYIDTYWFNLVAIWLSAIIFYITLVNDLLRRFVNWNEIRKLRKGL